MVKFTYTYLETYEHDTIGPPIVTVPTGENVGSTGLIKNVGVITYTYNF